jgi:hypothetical protein
VGGKRLARGSLSVELFAVYLTSSEDASTQEKYLRTARHSVSGKAEDFKKFIFDPPYPHPLPAGQWHEGKPRHR